MAYRYSYSGSDVRVYAHYRGLESEIVELESVHTIATSVHEAKGQARALGYRGIKGITRSVRTIAGTLIMNVINDHPLRPLIELARAAPDDYSNYSVDQYMVGVGSSFDDFDYTNRLASTLPAFNLDLRYVSEAAAFNLDAKTFDGTILGAGKAIRDIHIVDVGETVSVNDIVTEVTYNFFAQDIKPLAVGETGARLPADSFHDQTMHDDFMRRLLGPHRNREATVANRGQDPAGQFITPPGDRNA